MYISSINFPGYFGKENFDFTMTFTQHTDIWKGTKYENTY